MAARQKQLSEKLIVVFFIVKLFTFIVYFLSDRKVFKIDQIFIFNLRNVACNMFPFEITVLNVIFLLNSSLANTV